MQRKKDTVPNGKKNERRSIDDDFSPDDAGALDACGLLETILGYVIYRGNTGELARRLLDRYLTFGGVCDAPVDELKDDFGISENTAVLLKLLPHMSRLYIESKTENDRIGDCDEMGLRFQTKFIGRTNEALALLLGDSRGKVLFFGIISEGSLNSTDVPLRKIVDFALRYHAKYVLMAHNHPSGSALPSESDLKTTKIIGDTLKNIGIELVDHYIITDDDFVSLRQSKIMGKVIFTDDDP